MTDVSSPWYTRAEMTNVSSPWYTRAEMVEWDADFMRWSMSRMIPCIEPPIHCDGTTVIYCDGHTLRHSSTATATVIRCDGPLWQLSAVITYTWEAGRWCSCLLSKEKPFREWKNTASKPALVSVAMTCFVTTAMPLCWITSYSTTHISPHVTTLDLLWLAHCT